VSDSAERPIIETTTSVTPNALASQTTIPTLEAEKQDETAGSFATSEQQTTTELDDTAEHGPVLDPTTGSF